MIFRNIVVIFTICGIGHGVPLQKKYLVNPADITVKYFDKRLVGGIDAPEEFASYMAALVIGDRVTFFTCGGSIVSANLVLTAAHCIDSYTFGDQFLTTYRGVVGTNRWNSGGYNVYFKRFYIDPQWSWGTLHHDVGLLVLDRELIWSRTVAMIGINWEIIEGGEPCLVTGWGALGTWPNNILPDVLQLLQLNTISHKSCSEAMDAFLGPRPRPHIDKAVEMCTFHSVGHGTCNGDSGSPLISTLTKTVVGVVSRGFNCAAGVPDVFARISGFKSFILPIMNEYSVVKKFDHNKNYF